MYKVSFWFNPTHIKRPFKIDDIIVLKAKVCFQNCIQNFFHCCKVIPEVFAY